MKIGEIFQDSAEKLQKATKRGGKFAQKGLSLATEKVKENKEYFNQSIELKKDNSLIEKELLESHNYITNKANFLKELIAESDAVLQEKRQSLLDNQIARFKKLYALSVAGDKKNYVANIQNAINQLNLEDLASGKQISLKASQAIFQGLASGAITATTVFGLASTYGIATTGATIANLHGAASFSATLALLGGGSVKAGGLGMIAGMGVLGGLVTLPAAYVAGSIWSKSIRKNNEELKKAQHLMQVKQQEAEQIFTAYKRLNGLIVAMTYEISYAADMLDAQFVIFENSLANRNKDIIAKIRDLCAKTCLEASKFLTISIDENVVYKIEDLEVYLREVHKNIEQYYREMGVLIFETGACSNNELANVETLTLQSKKQALDDNELLSLLSYGDTRYLCRYYLKNKTLPVPMKDLLINLYQFCENIIVCAEGADIVENICTLASSFASYDKYQEKNLAKDKYENSFRRIYSNLFLKYSVLVKCKDLQKMKPCIIKWCVNNDLIQQSLTYFAEWTHEYMVENKLIVVNDVCVYECQQRRRRGSSWVDYLFKVYFPNNSGIHRECSKVEERCMVFAYLYETKEIKTNFNKENFLFLTQVFTEYLILRNNTNHAHGTGIDKEKCSKKLTKAMDILLSGRPL